MMGAVDCSVAEWKTRPIGVAMGRGMRLTFGPNEILVVRLDGSFESRSSGSKSGGGGAAQKNERASMRYFTTYYCRREII
jgi:hypothetical protein